MPRRKTICRFHGCAGLSYAQGYCVLHYKRWERHGDPSVCLIIRDCKVEGCGERHEARGYCKLHYRRLAVHGSTDEPPTRRSRMELTFAQRFWDRVKISGTDECWEWQGAAGAGGYGNVKRGGVKVGAHIIALELHQKKPVTQKVLHSCDRPLCCNPNHLREGTQKENVADSIRRGRRTQVFQGSKHYKAILTEADIPKIRALIAQKIPLSKIADLFHVGKGTISHIKSDRSWRHV